MSSSSYSLDARDAAQIIADLLARRPGYVPDWTSPDKGAGLALNQIVARNLQTILRRLDRAPAKGILAFLDVLGIQPIPARAARAVVVFQMSQGAADANVPAGTRLVASGGSGQVVFETIRASGVTSAKLVQVLSIWPGRDQWIDHSTAVGAGQPFYPFRIADLQNIPHAIYLAHGTLLALSGKSTLQVTFELATNGSSSLPIAWQYWDGAVWRDFASTLTACQGAAAPPDSTAGLSQSGRVILRADCAQS